jgi:NAD(P)-dependent dehydrogenase (short-subunit alcohol dehydrogenase family)
VTDRIQRFAGRVALIAGGASGLGRACAERLAGEGATVVVADLDWSRRDRRRRAASRGHGEDPVDGGFHAR